MHKRLLPGVSGSGEHHQISQGGAAADMAQYMGPTAGVSNILEILSVIFGTVASFDVLMQIFTKLHKEVARKCPCLQQD